MFWKKKIELTAYTYSPGYESSCPPIYRNVERPDWLTRLKNFYVDLDPKSRIPVKTPTVGVCPGIRDYLTECIQLNLWTDISIKIMPDGSWAHYVRPGWDDVTIGEHPKPQYGDAYNNRVSLKLTSPWYFVTDANVKFMFVESHYSTSVFRDNEIIIPPGVIDYKWQHSTNVHLSFPIKEQEYIVHLKHGTPLVSMFPMSERPVDFKVKLIDQYQWIQINEHFPKMFVGRYYKQAGKKS
jgi:hypothetical protein